MVSVKRLLEDLGGHQPWGQVASEGGMGRPRRGWGSGRSQGTNAGFCHSCFHITTPAAPQCSHEPYLLMQSSHLR